MINTFRIRFLVSKIISQVSPIYSQISQLDRVFGRKAFVF